MTTSYHSSHFFTTTASAYGRERGGGSGKGEMFTKGKKERGGRTGRCTLNQSLQLQRKDDIHIYMINIVIHTSKTRCSYFIRLPLRSEGTSLRYYVKRLQNRIESKIVFKISSLDTVSRSDESALVPPRAPPSPARLLPPPGARRRRVHRPGVHHRVPPASEGQDARVEVLGGLQVRLGKSAP